MESTFATEVRTFVVNNFLLGKEGTLSNDASFFEEGIIDSTGVLELVSFLEDTYGIEIGEGELNPENLDSISRIAAFLSRKLSGRIPAQPAAAEEAYSAD
jgi:acyl carrier protein